VANTRLPVFDRRRAGALLHMGSLEAGLGRGGRSFIDWLATAGFTVWQILPVGPTGSDGSPYWVRSDFAGNPAFIDGNELPDLKSPAYAAFLLSAAHWLEDYALFEVLSFVHGGAPWWNWPPELRDRLPDALTSTRQQFTAELDRVKGVQFAFYTQWQRLREHAASRGVRLFGDLPFYVAPDSAETWAHREQFQLDATGHPTAVAGVPPDYFSATGQLWGNPLYNWDVIRRDHFKLWRDRVAAQMERVDVLRIDHFRALAAYWSVPAGAPDARGGEWRPSPGEELMGMLWDDLGDLPIVPKISASSRPMSSRSAKASGCRACGSCSSRSVVRRRILIYPTCTSTTVSSTRGLTITTPPWAGIRPCPNRPDAGWTISYD